MKVSRRTMPTLILAALCAVGCEDSARVIPYSAEAESGGVVFRLEAVKDVFEEPRRIDSCTRGDACQEYLGKFRVEIRTSRSFSTILNTTVERGPQLIMFGVPCRVKVKTGDDLRLAEFECWIRDDLLPASNKLINLSPKLPGLYEAYAGSFDFPGRYDPESFPSRDVR